MNIYDLIKQEDLVELYVINNFKALLYIGDNQDIYCGDKICEYYSLFKYQILFIDNENNLKFILSNDVFDSGGQLFYSLYVYGTHIKKVINSFIFKYKDFDLSVLELNDIIRKRNEYIRET